MEFWEEILETPPIKEKNEEQPEKPQKIKSKKNKLPLIFLLIVLLAGIFVYFQWPRYELIPLGTSGGPLGSAEAINNNGQIAGWLQLPNGNTHAFIWDTEKGLRDLGTIGGKSSFAYDLNDKGQVVGYADNISGSRHAFVWDQKNGMNELITPEGDSSEAAAINNKGLVAGTYITQDNQHHAFLWDSHAGFKDLGTLYGKASFAKDINEKDQVVGDVIAPNGKHHAFLWDKQNNLMTDITGPNGPDSYAMGINNKGQVVGNIFVQGMNNYSGFIWEKSKGLEDLKISKNESYADKINDSEQIIGYLEADKFFIIPKKSFSFIRTKLGIVINLNNSGRTDNDMIKVNAINNNGWMAGQIDSKSLNPRYQPVLLKPRQSPLGLLIKIFSFKKDKN